MAQRHQPIRRLLVGTFIGMSALLTPSCVSALEGEVPVTPAAAPILGPIIDAADKTLQTADQAAADVVTSVGSIAKSVVISVNNGQALGHQAQFKPYMFRVNERRFLRGLPPSPESRIARRQAERRFQLGIK